MPLELYFLWVTWDFGTLPSLFCGETTYPCFGRIPRTHTHTHTSSPFCPHHRPFSTYTPHTYRFSLFLALDTTHRDLGHSGPHTPPIPCRRCPLGWEVFVLALPCALELHLALPLPALPSLGEGDPSPSPIVPPISTHRQETIPCPSHTPHPTHTYLPSHSGGTFWTIPCLGRCRAGGTAFSFLPSPPPSLPSPMHSLPQNMPSPPPCLVLPPFPFSPTPTPPSPFYSSPCRMMEEVMDLSLPWEEMPIEAGWVGDSGDCLPDLPPPSPCPISSLSEAVRHSLPLFGRGTCLPQFPHLPFLLLPYIPL